MSNRPITVAEIEASRSAKGGWNAKQLRLWGIAWPPTTGWRKRLLKFGVPASCPYPEGFTPTLPLSATMPKASDIVEDTVAAETLRSALVDAIEIFTDGACDPNPGPGGWGFSVYRDKVETHSAYGGDIDTTNNRMELAAIAEALAWLASDQPAIIWTDSQYCQKGCTIWRQVWKAKGWRRGAKAELANAGQWQELDALLDARRVEVRWTRGHVGTLGNERADELADMGRQSALDAASPMRVIEEQLQPRF